MRPIEVFYGGDPTGRFTELTWQSWGGSEARGSGTGWWVGQGDAVANGEYAPVRLVAFDLTTCDGQPVYRRLAIYFPTKGEEFDRDRNGETQYDLCEGP